MTLADAKARHATLLRQVQENVFRYHALQKPALSDIDYDRLCSELQMLERQFPGELGPKGFIYCSSNPAMAGLLKIGMTERSVEKRMRELGAGSGIPEPFKLEFQVPVYGDFAKAERQAHSILARYRTSPKREFFRISVNSARRLLVAAIVPPLR